MLEFRSTEPIFFPNIDVEYLVSYSLYPLVANFSYKHLSLYIFSKAFNSSSLFFSVIRPL